MICKMHSVSCLTVCVVLIALFHFADMQRLRSRFTRSANSDTGSHNLPSDLQPLHYDLVIDPDIYQEDSSMFSFEGRVTIKMKCISPTTTIVLNAKNLIINQTDIVVSGPAGNLTVVNLVLNDEMETLTISLGEELRRDENYTVQIDYSGPLRDDPEGLYFSAYERDGQTVYLATTFFQYENARKAFPCMDESALKATFTIHVIRRSFNLAVSNMPVETTRNLTGDKMADDFETSVPMGTDQVAFIVCEFARKTKMTNRNVKVEVWSRQEVVDQMNFALDFGVKTIEFLEQYFQILYPLPKLSMVGLTDFAAYSTEVWGLVMDADEIFSFNDQTITIIDKMITATNVANRICRMWQGNLVTPVSLGDFWLSRALASFMENKVFDHVYPDRRMMDYLLSDVQKAMIEDGFESSAPLSDGYDELNGYPKGAFVLRMLHSVIGDDKFRKGMKKYLSTQRYGSAHDTDLWNALEDDELDVSIADFMSTWTQQMNYPVVTVTTEGQTVTLTQERFLQDPSAEDPGDYILPFGYKWDIPFTFTSSDQQNFDITASDVIWFTKDDEQKTITIPTLSEDSWVIGNIGLNGFYRVNYDDNNWRKLLAQLHSDPTAIGPLNRVQIIGDIFALSRAGLVNKTRALEALEYLDKETEYAPWSAATDELYELSKILSNTDIFPAFKAFMVEKTRPLFVNLRMTPVENTTETQIRRLIASTACKYDGPECIEAAVTHLHDWKNNPDNRIPEVMHYAVYCGSMHKGNTDDWDFVYERFLAESDPLEKQVLMTSLSCTNNSNDLDRLLDRALNSQDFTTENFMTVLQYTILNPVGSKRAWTFISNTWDSQNEKYRADGFPFTISHFGDVFSTQDQLQKLQDFVDEQEHLGEDTEAFSAVVDDITKNVAWMERNAGTMRNWLQKQGFSA